MNSVEIRRNFWYQMSQFSTVYNAQGPLTTESPEAPSWHSNGLSAMVGTGCVLTGLLLLVNWAELEGDSHQVTSHILAPATTQPVTSQVSALTTTLVLATPVQGSPTTTTYPNCLVVMSNPIWMFCLQLSFEPLSPANLTTWWQR